MSSLSDIEWTRAYHNLRRDGADIDGVRETPLNEHLRGLVFHGFEEDRIQVRFAAAVNPGEYTVLAGGNARNRENAKPVRESGADEFRVVAPEWIQQHSAVRDRLIFRVSDHAGHHASGTGNRQVQSTARIGREHEARVEHLSTAVTRGREIDFRWQPCQVNPESPFRNARNDLSLIHISEPTRLLSISY